MKFNRFFRGVIVLVALLLPSHSIAQEETTLFKKKTPPNVVLIMADDLGWGDTGYYGHPILKTPNLDRMASDGIRFDRFYSAAPVCSPTRGSAITGRHPFRYGVYHANVGHLKPNELTLAERLKTLGYTTGHFGKWHLGTLTKTINDSNRGQKSPLDYSPPWENGFEHCFSTEAKTPTWWAEDAYASFGTRYWIGEGQAVGPEKIVGDDSRIIMNEAIEFVERSTLQEKKFFAVIWFHAPHKPIIAGPKYLEMYQSSIPKDKVGQKENAAHYYGCITAMDEQIGRLRDKLDELGVSEETMIWFCSDNGPENKTAGRTTADLDGPEGRPPVTLRARKRSLFEGGIRVPGLLVWPGKATPGSRISVPCVTSDFLPTVLAAAGYDVSDDGLPIDGVDLFPIIVGEVTQRSNPIGFQSGNQKAMIGNRYKIIKRGTGDWGLFDLQADPGESHDLANENPAIVQEMTARFSQWRQSCADSNRGWDYPPH